MSLSLVVDLHNLHVLGFGFVGAVKTKEQFGRTFDTSDPLHLLHTASVLAIAPRVLYAANEWLGPQFSPRSDLAIQRAKDLGLESLTPAGSTQTERESIVTVAAELLENDLDAYCSKASIGGIGDRVAKGLGTKEQDATLATRRLMMRRHSSDELADALETYREYPNGTNLLMMALRPSLHTAIHDRFWPSIDASVATEIATDRLETLFRMYTYLSFSKIKSGPVSWYSPQFDRVLSWQDKAHRWAAALNNQTTGAREQELAIMLDDVSTLLLRRSAGNPGALLKLAAEFRRDHGAAIDKHFVECVSSYEGRSDEAAANSARLLHDELRREFVKSDAVRMRLDGFLAAHGAALVASEGATDDRRVIVKSVVHGDQGRMVISENREFSALGRAMEDGSTTRVFGADGARLRETIKSRLKTDERELVTAVRKGAILCYGAGVTMFSVENGDDYSWARLTLKGLHTVRKKVAHSKRAEAAIRLLGELPESLTYRYAGDVIRESLSAGEWRELLSSWFEDLRAVRPELVEAIAALSNDRDVRLATTNYDRVFESAMLRHYVSCVPSEEAKVESFLTDKKSRYVFHIHGIYDMPTSVVLGNMSYGLLAGNKTFHYLERLYSERLIFVGFAGFDDPTFVRLIEATAAFSERIPHIALLTRDEAADSYRKFDGHRIRIVVYGDTYADLPEFLHALREVAK